jgi:hypothetical protein
LFTVFTNKIIGRIGHQKSPPDAPDDFVGENARCAR